MKLKWSEVDLKTGYIVSVKLTLTFSGIIETSKQGECFYDDTECR